MYPTLSKLLEDLLGINIPLPIHTFGLMVALAFLAGAYVLAKEFRRKEKEGHFNIIQKKVLVGAPASIQDLVINGLIWFVLGFKLVAFALNYQEFVDDPQGFLLSLRGNWIGGILIGAIGAYLKYNEKKKEQLEKPKWQEIKLHPYQLIGDITTYAFVGGILGAKIFHNLEYPEEFISDPIGALTSFSGLTFYGGLLGGAIAVIWFTRKHNLSTLHLIDAAAPGLMLAYGVGRVGCQLSGDGDWGIANPNPKPDWMSFLPDWMWKFKFPHNVISEGIPIPGCEGKFCYELAEAVYPTPFYESVMAIALFAFLMSIRKKLTTPGVLFCVYLIVNGIERFFIEKIRVNATYEIFGSAITQAEIISTILVLAGIGGIIYLKKK